MFKKQFGVRLLSAIISLVVFAGCSENNTVSMPDLYDTVQAQANDYSDDLKIIHGDVSVKFNNAYQGLYVENEKIGMADPENPDKLFKKIIDAAKNTLDIAVFDIDDENAVNAIIAAKKRGVKVRVVTDSDNISEKGSPGTPRKVLQKMKSSGITIKDDKRNAFMHHKFVIVDNRIVLTGSLNLTWNALYRDNNNSLKITSKELAANYKAEFDRMFEHGIFGPNQHEIPNKSVHVEGSTIKTFFSPKGGTKEAILNELNKAQKSIKFMAFSLTDKDVQQVLLSKFKAKIDVGGIFDGCMISQYSAYESLITKNIPVLIDGNQALLHEKVFIIDGYTVITGSYNFSSNAEDSNNENTLIIKSATIAHFYEAEFERLKNASMTNKNIPPYDNRACSSRESGNDIGIN